MGNPLSKIECAGEAAYALASTPFAMIYNLGSLGVDFVEHPLLLSAAALGGVGLGHFVYKGLFMPLPWLVGGAAGVWCGYLGAQYLDGVDLKSKLQTNPSSCSGLSGAVINWTTLIKRPYVFAPLFLAGSTAAWLLLGETPIAIGPLVGGVAAGVLGAGYV
jgi:hypothetical protein